MAHAPQSAIKPEFVCRETAARRCEVSVDTWDGWVRDGFVPPPAIERGQIKRWHWQGVEARLLESREADKNDPFMQGVVKNAEQAVRGRCAS
jgi:hypothetical protein